MFGANGRSLRDTGAGAGQDRQHEGIAGCRRRIRWCRPPQADKNAGGDAHQVDADLKASLKKCDAGL
jgi:hypothetical protein